MSGSLQQITLTRSHGTREQRLDRLVLHTLYECLGFIATNEMKFAGDSA
jgi:hypothetical protein